MTDRLQYGTTAKVFHWLIVALLLVQYPIGWLMPDIHRDMKPGAPMTFQSRSASSFSCSLSCVSRGG